MERLWR